MRRSSVADEAAVRAVRPDFAALANPPYGGRSRLAATSRTSRAACSSAYSAIHEDPVTGSAHAAIVPFWADRLGRPEFTALQASERTGLLQCRLEGDRVVLGGHCHTVIVGQFQL